jgi:hypothetical protein
MEKIIEHYQNNLAQVALFNKEYKKHYWTFMRSIKDPDFHFFLLELYKQKKFEVKNILENKLFNN